MPAPDIVRARVGQRSAAQQLDDEEQSQKEDRGAEQAGAKGNSPPPAAPNRADESGNQDHPLLTSNSPRRRSTAPASFGTNSVSKLRAHPEPRSKQDHEPSDPVFIGMGEETMVIKDNPTVAKAASGGPAPAAATGSPIRPNAALLMGCPACDARISKRAARCPKCNTAPYQPCQVCATTIMVNSESCGECGDPDPFNAEALNDARA